MAEVIRIARLLYENKMKSERDDLLSAIIPLLKLLSLTMIGLVLSRFEMIPRSTFKLLSKLVFALFLPCLIFTHLGQSMTLENFIQWWFIPVNVVLSTAIGCLLGYVVVLVCRPPPQFNRFVVIMTGFGNTGNLPLAIVSSVCHNADNPFGPHCPRKGVAYVSFAQWVSVILVYHMMELPLAYYEIVQEETETEVVEQPDDVSAPLLVDAEWPGIGDKETEYSKKPFIARVFNSISSLPEFDPKERTITRSDSPLSVPCFAAPRVVRKISVVAEQTPIRHILQPPTIEFV